MASTILEGIIMNLVETIEKEAKYKPDELEVRIIHTIQSGSDTYKNLWSNFCSPEETCVHDPNLLYNEVVQEFCKEAYDDLKQVKTTAPTLYALSAGPFLVGLFVSPLLFALGGIGLIGTHIYSKTINRNANKYIKDWYNYPKEFIVESIGHIKEKADNIIYEYTK